MNANYTLEVISHHSQFKNKALRQYYVDGINTVGAWGNEEFEVRFTNKTWQKVQVKISLDGTDIFTGETATTEPTKDMWVVQPYGTLSLRAWPESNNGGAAFVFTSANNSVAVHTHGDLSSRGIIAAAVFTEGHVEPVRTDPHCHHHCYGYYCITCNPNWWVSPYNYYWGNGVFLNGSNTYGSDGGTFGGTGGFSSGGGGTYTSSVIPCSTNGNLTSTVSNNVSTQTFDCFNTVSLTGDVSLGESLPSDSRERPILGNLVSVGAGQHVDQQITYVQGLIKPVFAESVRVRYLWWDDLVAKLKQTSAPAPHASGFPGDKKHGIDLKKTPRQGSFKRAEQPELQYQRV